jgi:hypothetical protein
MSVRRSIDNFSTRSSDTLKGFACMLRLEAALRQLVIEQLSAIAGPKWHKQRLPSDVNEKLVEGPKYERAFKWFEFTPHHPICYVDFPDLLKIIVRADNWNTCFSAIFGNKDNLAAKYREIELVRNKIAHTRY